MRNLCPSLLFVIALLLVLSLPGCAIVSSSLDQARKYNSEEKYDDAVCQLTDIIDSDSPAIKKAEAFMLRGEAYTAMKEYRYAYRDLQVAWKLTCHLYQNGPEPSPQAPAPPFDTARSCIEDIPLLIDTLKPFTSDFGAIIATQEASAIVKRLFPEIPR